MPFKNNTLFLQYAASVMSHGAQKHQKCLFKITESKRIMEPKGIMAKAGKDHSRSSSPTSLHKQVSLE